MKKYSVISVAVFVIGLMLTPMLYAGPSSKCIKKLYDGDRAFSHVQVLEAFGPRVAGGDQERAAADYIADEMASYGLDVEIQTFPIIYFEDVGSELIVVDGDILAPNTLSYSPSGDFTSGVVYCGLGYPEDFPPEVAGSIALIKRGEMSFYDKTVNASAAGAQAVIIFNHSPGNFFGTLGDITDIPAVSISLEQGSALLDLVNGGPVTVSLSVSTDAYPTTSQNVIGTLEGRDPSQGIVYIGGHYDSVSAGPGANDNATGTASVLETARVLATRGHKTKATLKFIAFGAEEIGLNGSEYYVTTNEAELVEKGLGMINLDMVGVGDTLLIGCIGTAALDLTDYAQAKATTMGITPWEAFTAESNSDHTYFEMVGVPSVFLQQSPDPNYHTAEDTSEKIDPVALEKNGELGCAVMYDWAKNPNLRTRKAAAKMAKVHVYRDRVHKTK